MRRKKEREIERERERGESDRARARERQREEARARKERPAIVQVVSLARPRLKGFRKGVCFAFNLFASCGRGTLRGTLSLS